MPKRAAGEGSLSRRADGRWRGRLRFGYGPDGKPVRREVYGATQADARRKLDALKARRDASGGAAPPGRVSSVGQFLEDWLAGYEQTVRPSTFQRARLIIRKHLIPALGRHPIDRLSPQDVQAMLDAKRDSLSPRSVQYLRVVLGTALRQAERWGLVTRNAASLTTPPKVERAEIEPLSRDDAGRVLGAVAGDRLGVAPT